MPKRKTLKEIMVGIKEERKNDALQVVNDDSLERLISNRMMFHEVCFDELFHKGDVVKNSVFGESKETKGMAPARLNNIKNMMKKMYDLYSRNGGKPLTEEAVTEVMDMYLEKDSNICHDFLWLGQDETEFWRVVENKQKGDERVVRFKKIDKIDRSKILLEIADLLGDKLTKEQVKQMLVVALRQNVNDEEILLRLKKELTNDSKPQIIETRKGCWIVDVNGVEACVLR